jgi:hypothetical protein
LAFLVVFLAAVAAFLATTLSKSSILYFSFLTLLLISFYFAFLTFSTSFFCFSKVSFIALVTFVSSFAFCLSNLSYSAFVTFVSSNTITASTSAVPKNYAFPEGSPIKLSFFPRYLFFFSSCKASFKPSIRYSVMEAFTVFDSFALVSLQKATLDGFFIWIFENCYIRFIV